MFFPQLKMVPGVGAAQQEARGVESIIHFSKLRCHINCLNRDSLFLKRGEGQFWECTGILRELKLSDRQRNTLGARHPPTAPPLGNVSYHVCDCPHRWLLLSALGTLSSHQKPPIIYNSTERLEWQKTNISKRVGQENLRNTYQGQEDYF